MDKKDITKTTIDPEILNPSKISIVGTVVPIHKVSICGKEFNFPSDQHGPVFMVEEKMKCRIYRINKDNPLPKKAHPSDAGWDVYASEDVKFFEDQTKLVPLGIIAEAPAGFYWQLVLRSSMAIKRGFSLGNSIGVIDSSFAGEKDEIKAIIKAPTNFNSLPNLSDRLCENGVYDEVCSGKEFIMIKAGERIGQLILQKVIDFEWDEQEERNFAGESRCGFGSTGSK